MTQCCSWKYEHRLTSNGSSKEVLEKCKYLRNEFHFSGVHGAMNRSGSCNSPLDDPGKNKIRCTPRGTKVAIYHIVGILMLNSMHNVVSLVTCAESL